MNIEKINKLKKDFSTYQQTGRASEFYLKMQIINAMQNKNIDTFRAEEIARRVAKKYSLDRQLEIVLYGDPSEITLLKSYRAMITAEVDQIIKNLEKELT